MGKCCMIRMSPGFLVCLNCCGSDIIMLKPFTSILLVFLILVTSAGVSGQVHDCRVKGRLVGWYGSAVSCCSKVKVKPKRVHGSCCKLNRMKVTTVRRVPCCQDQVRYQHLDIQQIVKQDQRVNLMTKQAFAPFLMVEHQQPRQTVEPSAMLTPRAHPPPDPWDPQAFFCQYRC